MKEIEKFVVSQKGLLFRGDKCLIMEIKRNPGYWDLPGGRIDVGELGEEAFKREITEELGFKNFEIKMVISYDTWLVHKKPVCGIINLIKNNNDEITLSEEHTQMKWISKDEVDDYDYIWECLPETIKKGFEYNK